MATRTSSDTLLELMDSGHISLQQSSRIMVHGARVREEREEEREDVGDERGFDYTTTANIARHLRSDTMIGEC